MLEKQAPQTTKEVPADSDTYFIPIYVAYTHWKSIVV